MAEATPRLFGGIDIGGTKILALIADETGRVLARTKTKAKADKGFAAVCARAAALVNELCTAHKIPRERLVAVGVGAPSPILPDGRAVAATNLGWRNVPLTATLARLIGRPVFAENDCNVGTLGESVFGAARGAKTTVGLFMGTGLGGGIVFHGELVTGDNHMAAELGHMVVKAGGRLCGCGHRGCLEAYASKTGMGRRFAQEVMGAGRASAIREACPNGQFGLIRSSVLRELYHEGDEVVVETVREAAWFLGLGAGNYITIFGPDVLVVGGGVMEALGRELLPHVKAGARESVWPASALRTTRIALSKLGDDAVALGAVAYAMACLDGKVLVLPKAGKKGQKAVVKALKRKVKPKTGKKAVPGKKAATKKRG